MISARDAVGRVTVVSFYLWAVLILTLFPVGIIEPRVLGIHVATLHLGLYLGVSALLLVVYPLTYLTHPEAHRDDSLQTTLTDHE